MDYEKAYNDAMARLEFVARTGLKLDPAYIFPELAESEDDKIRKAIESIIRVYGKTQGEWIAGYDMDTLVVHLRNAFASLEKQKESLHISETCKENADSFTDEDERIRKEIRNFLIDMECKKEWIAHMEKQKKTR